jgi:hypothetical protein
MRVGRFSLIPADMHTPVWNHVTCPEETTSERFQPLASLPLRRGGDAASGEKLRLGNSEMTERGPSAAFVGYHSA